MHERDFTVSAIVSPTACAPACTRVWWPPLVQTSVWWVWRAVSRVFLNLPCVHMYLHCFTPFSVSHISFLYTHTCFSILLYIHTSFSVLTPVSVYYCRLTPVSVYSCTCFSILLYILPSMVTWSRRTETWSCASSALAPLASSLPQTCWLEGSMCSRSRSSSTMIYLLIGKTIFTGESVQYSRYCMVQWWHRPRRLAEDVCICDWKCPKDELECVNLAYCCVLCDNGTVVHHLSFLSVGLAEEDGLAAKVLPSTLWRTMMSARWRILSSSTTPRSMRCLWMWPTWSSATSHTRLLSRRTSLSASQTCSCQKTCVLLGYILCIHQIG